MGIRNPRLSENRIKQGFLQVSRGRIAVREVFLLLSEWQVGKKDFWEAPVPKRIEN